MKRAAVLLLIAAGLTGCADSGASSGTSTGTDGTTLRSYTVNLPDGQTVPCVVYPGVGISCDWGNVP